MSLRINLRARRHLKKEIGSLHFRINCLRDHIKYLQKRDEFDLLDEYILSLEYLLKMNKKILKNTEEFQKYIEILSEQNSLELNYIYLNYLYVGMEDLEFELKRSKCYYNYYKAKFGKVNSHTFALEEQVEKLQSYLFLKKLEIAEHEDFMKNNNFKILGNS